MVTLQELEQQRLQAQNTRENLARQRSAVVKSAQSKSSLLGSGLTGRQSRASTIRSAGQETEKERSLREYESQLRGAEEQVKAQESIKDLTGAYNTALALYNQGIPAQGTGGDVGRILRDMYKNYFTAQQNYEKELLKAQSLPAVTEQVVQDNFVGPKLPTGWTPPVEKNTNIIQDVGRGIKEFGAGIGNVIRGQDFYTPVRTNTGTDIYPSGEVKVRNVPAEVDIVKTTTGTKYVPTQEFQRNYNPNLKQNISLGDEIKSEGFTNVVVKKANLVKEEVLKGTENVLNFFGNVGNLPSPYKDTLVGRYVASKTKLNEPETLGQSAQALTKTISKTGEVANKLTEDLFFKVGIQTEYTVPEKYVPQYQTSSISVMGTNILSTPTSIFIPEHKEKNIIGVYKEASMFGQRLVPEAASWIFAPEVMIPATVLSSSEKLKNVDSEANKILEQQYLDYSKTIPTEGNRLLTEEEFFKEYKTDTVNELKSQASIEGGGALLFGALGITGKVVGGVKNLKVIKFEKALAKSNELLNIEQKTKEANIKSYLESTKKAGLSPYEKEGGLIKEYNPLDFGRGKTTLFDVKTLEGTSKLNKLTREDLINVQKSEISLAGGQLKLSPDVGFLKFEQVTPRISKAINRNIEIRGTSANIRNGKGTLSGAFFGAGKDNYIVFESVLSKRGRVSKLGELGKYGERQIVKATKVEEGIKVEYRSLRPKEGNFYLSNIDELSDIARTKNLKKAFENAKVLKTEILKYKEIPVGNEIKLEAVSTLEEQGVRRSVSTIKDIFGTSYTTKSIPKKFIPKVVKQKFILPKELILEKPITFVEYTPFKVTNTPYSKNFGGGLVSKDIKLTTQDLKEFSKITPKILPKVKVPKVSSISVKSDLIESSYPTYVGGIARSEYGATSSFIDTRMETINPTILQSKNELSLVNNVDVKTIEISKVKVKEIELLKPQIKEQITENVIQHITKEKVIELTKPQSKLILKEIIKTQQKQKQKTKELQKQLNKNRGRNNEFNIKGKILELPSYTLPSEKKVSKESINDLFKVYGKRYGKDIKLFETGTKEEAETKLKGFLTGTLGRSGFVEKEGERISFNELNLGSMFRPSKRESTRVVQKAKFSLGTSQERSEIKLARRRSLYE